MKSKVVLIVDGAYSKTRNVGGYGCILQYFIYDLENELYQLKKEHSFSATIEDTTNNRMELLAAIEGLKFIKIPCEVEIISDSTYVVNTINIWINKFVNDINRLNLDLMIELYKAIQKHKSVKAKWVRGHSDNILNERANKLAQIAAGTWRGKE